MPRLMSVAMTTQAVIERRKTVCRKVQGRKPGEALDRLAVTRIEWRYLDESEG